MKNPIIEKIIHIDVCDDCGCNVLNVLDEKDILKIITKKNYRGLLEEIVKSIAHKLKGFSNLTIETATVNPTKDKKVFKVNFKNKKQYYNIILHEGFDPLEVRAFHKAVVKGLRAKNMSINHWKNPILEKKIDIYYEDKVNGKFHDGTLYTTITETALNHILKNSGWNGVIKHLEKYYNKLHITNDSNYFDTSHEDYGTMMGEPMTREYHIDISNLDPDDQLEFRKAVIKRKNPNKIPGGLAEGCLPEDFNQKELQKGVLVEMEHTDDPEIAQEIAMDHLFEDPKYYVKLAKMEKKDNPSGMVHGKRQEKKWKEAKKIVLKSRGIKPSKFDDLDWGLVTKIFKNKAHKKNPSSPLIGSPSDKSPVSTFEYWAEKLYKTPKQAKVLKKLLPELPFLFDLELFVESHGASESEDDDFPQEPGIIRIIITTDEDRSVGLYAWHLSEIAIDPKGKVLITQGSNWLDYIEEIKDDKEFYKEFLKYFEDLQNKLNN